MIGVQWTVRCEPVQMGEALFGEEVDVGVEDWGMR